MRPEEFEAAVRAGGEPAPDLEDALRVLWLDAAGEWERAHDIAQDMPDPNGALLHAYLHRKEGDLGNAGYWYRRAGEEMPSGSLESEWRGLVRTMHDHATPARPERARPASDGRLRRPPA